MRHYAVREDTGERVLVELECDECGARLKPGPDVSRSGWIKVGGREKTERHYCPSCLEWVGLGGA